jgi:hypothetical protein
VRRGILWERLKCESERENETHINPVHAKLIFRFSDEILHEHNLQSLEEEVSLLRRRTKTIVERSQLQFSSAMTILI